MILDHFYTIHQMYGPQLISKKQLAQFVECVTDEREVTGSNPELNFFLYSCLRINILKTNSCLTCISLTYRTAHETV